MLQNNVTAELPSFVTHLECSKTGKHYEADKLHGLSDAGYPLLVRYDLPALGQAFPKEALREREPDFWRYREFLPMRHASSVTALGECLTPLVPLLKSARHYGVKGNLLVKDEGRLPTGSFKARGLGIAVSMARELGVKKCAMPTNGNAGAALAAYCTRADIETFIFCPEDTPDINIREMTMQGAKVWKINGLINDCGKIVGEGKEKMGWFDFSTLKEPYRIEGKKTLGMEIAEQYDWNLPDAIFYPTGGGTGLIGMWKAFDEMEQAGWIGPQRPKMIAVQAAGCAPIVRAFEEGGDHAELWQGATTYASGIRVPAAIGDFLILEAVRDSKGFAIAVEDEAIEKARIAAAQEDGLLLCPEGAATYAAWQKAVDEGRIAATDRALLVNSCTGLKYPMPDKSGELDRTQKIDYTGLLA
ncbi:MAG: threonine synthase [bacterium]